MPAVGPRGQRDRDRTCTPARAPFPVRLACAPRRQVVSFPHPGGMAGRAAPAGQRMNSVGAAHGPGIPRDPGKRAPRQLPEPKCEAAESRGGRLFTQRQSRVTRAPLPAREEDVEGMQGAPAVRRGLGAVPGDPGLRRGRGRLLHAGPDPRAPDARVFLLCGSSGPGGPGAWPERAHRLERWGQRGGACERGGAGWVGGVSKE